MIETCVYCIPYEGVQDEHLLIIGLRKPKIAKKNLNTTIVRHSGVIDSIPAFQHDGQRSIPGGVWDWVCVLCTLSCVVSDDGPDILLTTDSGRPALDPCS